MKAGILREKIEIYKPETITTEYGDSETEYVLHYTTRASILYNSGTKTNENNEVFYPTTKTFIVRHYVPVDEPMRIKFEDKYYQILSVNKNKYYNDITIVADLVNE